MIGRVMHLHGKETCRVLRHKIFERGTLKVGLALFPADVLSSPNYFQSQGGGYETESGRQSAVIRRQRIGHRAFDIEHISGRVHYRLN